MGIKEVDGSVEISFSTNMMMRLYVGQPPKLENALVLKGVGWTPSLAKEIARRISLATDMEVRYVGANRPDEALYQFREKGDP